ncbi:MAG: hypothetical protein Q7Q71_16570 [Verrucomicrobiota bacterium JB023]|nr:hypothetical protein [Verrucomicrobiota bacterium JB023]
MLDKEMTVQDLTTGVGQFLGPVLGIYLAFKLTNWSLLTVLLVGGFGGLVGGVFMGLFVAFLLRHL